MGASTGIGWTDSTWNMIRAVHNVTKKIGWMCVRVSQGCVNCYAASLNRRLGNGEDYTVPGLGDVTPFLDERALVLPLRERKGRRIFVCSMTDLFGEWVPDVWIDRVFAVMALTQRHTYQILTKRPERMRAYCASNRARAIVTQMDALCGPTIPKGVDRDGTSDTPLPNVHLGVSVEDQATANARIPHLFETPAAVRWVSYEPALAPVDFTRIDGGALSIHYEGIEFDALHGFDMRRTKLDWIVIGGESGADRRPFELAWLESVVSQCTAAGVPLFVKQDSAPRPGQRGRIPDHLWRHEFPC